VHCESYRTTFTIVLFFWWNVVNFVSLLYFYFFVLNSPEKIEFEAEIYDVSRLGVAGFRIRTPGFSVDGITLTDFPAKLFLWLFKKKFLGRYK